MEKKIHLTNENLAKKFKNNFDLVNYAIKLAENMIRTGRDARVKSDLQNRAMLVLEEIEEGKDQFDQIPEPQQAQVNGSRKVEEEVFKTQLIHEEEERPTERRQRVPLRDDEDRDFI